VVGENVEIVVELVNTASVERSRLVKLWVDGKLIGQENVSLPAGGSKSLSFRYTFETVGSYTVKVGRLSKKVEVVQKPEVDVTSLTITPSEPMLGQEVTITVTVVNTGSTATTCKVTLWIDENAVGENEVSLAAGATKEVTFTYKFQVAGYHTVKAGRLSKSVNVKQPQAKFVVENLVLNPTKYLLEKPVNIQVSVGNIGDNRGTLEVSLVIDGREIERKSVTLDPGATQALNFTYTFNIMKSSYKIEVGGLSAEIYPLAPQPSVGDKWYYFLTSTEGDTGCGYPVLGKLENNQMHLTITIYMPEGRYPHWLSQKRHELHVLVKPSFIIEGADVAIGPHADALKAVQKTGRTSIQASNNLVSYAIAGRAVTLKPSESFEFHYAVGMDVDVVPLEETDKAASDSWVQAEKRAREWFDAYFSSAPKPPGNLTENQLKYYYGAIWVLRHNQYYPSGMLTYPIIRPAVSYYDAIWNWDTAFHVFALRDIDPEMAKMQILQLCLLQDNDPSKPDYGMIRTAYGTAWDEVHSQPPLLSWAVVF
jgi:hypothetical protein